MAPCSGVSIVDLEEVNFGWKESNWGVFFGMILTCQFGIGDGNAGTGCAYVPCTWNVDRAHKKRSEDLLDVFWAFCVRSLCFLCLGGSGLTRPQNVVIKQISQLLLVFLLLSLSGVLFVGMVYIKSIRVSIIFVFPIKWCHQDKWRLFY